MRELSVGGLDDVLYPVLINELTCPVTAIKNCMRVRKSTASHAPFFVDFQGTPLSSGRFIEKLKKVMDEVGTWREVFFQEFSLWEPHPMPLLSTSRHRILGILEGGLLAQQFSCTM